MKALVKNECAPGLKYMDMEVPTPKANEALIETKAIGICGSDVHVYNWTPNYEYMKDYFPLIPGHEYCGIVREVGENVTKVKPGDRVVCMFTVECGQCENCKNGKRFLCTEGSKFNNGFRKNGGFAKYSVHPEDGLVVLPDSVTDKQAAMVEPMSVTSNAVDKAQLRLGDTVVVMGPGPIGLLTLLFAKVNGAGTCIMVGMSQDKKRLELARELGADYILASDECDLKEEVMKITNGNGADVVFEATGVAALVQTSVDLLTQVGKVVCISIYAKPSTLEMTAMVRNAQSILCTYAGGPVTWPRIVKWLSSENYYAKQTEKIVTHTSRLADVDEAFARCNNKENIKELFVDFD